MMRPDQIRRVHWRSQYTVMPETDPEYDWPALRRAWVELGDAGLANEVRWQTHAVVRGRAASPAERDVLVSWLDDARERLWDDASKKFRAEGV